MYKQTRECHLIGVKLKHSMTSVPSAPDQLNACQGRTSSKPRFAAAQSRKQPTFSEGKNYCNVLFYLTTEIASLHGAFHCGQIVAFGRLWLFICWVTLKKATLLNATQKIKATIDQKPQFGHNEMRHVNRLKKLFGALKMLLKISRRQLPVSLPWLRAW